MKRFRVVIEKTEKDSSSITKESIEIESVKSPIVGESARTGEILETITSVTLLGPASEEYVDLDEADFSILKDLVEDGCTSNIAPFNFH